MPRYLFFLLLLFPDYSHAGSDNGQLDVFHVPWSLQIITGTTSPTSRRYCPIVTNRIPGSLKGKIYDVREVFETLGRADFKKSDFAWYSPESQLLTVRTSPANMDIIHTLLEATTYDPPQNVTIDAKIVIPPPADSKAIPPETMNWKITARSGQQCVVSSTGSDQPGYFCQCEPVVGPDGKGIDCNMILKITYKGHEYATTTSFAVFSGKPHTMLIGTTHDKQDITFCITVAVVPVYPALPLDDPKTKERLLKRIKKELIQ